MNTYTMADIKSHVVKLRIQSLDQYREKLNTEFEKYIEEHPEIQVEISEYEGCCKTATALHNKYVTESWRRHGYSCNYSRNLKSIIKDSYFEKKRDEIQKIKDQFEVIINKLKTMRNPNKAIEFLKLCGIEMPEEAQTAQEEIPVDPEFIKSILPAPKQLTNTVQEAA